MTIHRMLGFYPEFYDAVDPDSGEMRQTMRFVPSYNKENLLPWDIIVVDEAGMCGLDLWHLIWAACKPTTRIFLVGDIQQLPPTHGKSIFGFAMANRSEEHTSELQSLMRISYAVFCLKKKNTKNYNITNNKHTMTYTNQL